LLVNGGLNASCANPPTTHNAAHCDGGIGDGTPVLAIGLADAEQIFYLAFTALSSNATFSNARNATVAMAVTLFLADGSGDADVDEGGNLITINEPQATSDAWEAVGLAPPALPAPDTTPPTVTSVGYSLIDDSDLVDPGTDVVITFSEPVNGVDNTSFTLNIAGGPDITGTVTVAADRQSATFDPMVSLPETADIEVNVGTSVMDDSDNNLDPSFTSSFTTGTAPVVTGPAVTKIVIKVEQKGPNYQAIAEVYSDRDTLIEGDFYLNSTTTILNSDSGTVGGKGFVKLQSIKVPSAQLSGSDDVFTITIITPNSGVLECSVSVAQGTEICLEN